MIRVRRDGRIKELPVVVAEAPSRIRIRTADESREAGQSWFYTPAPDVARVPPLAPARADAAAHVHAHRPANERHGAVAPVGLTLPRPFEFAPSGVAGAQLVTITDGIEAESRSAVGRAGRHGAGSARRRTSRD